MHLSYARLSFVVLTGGLLFSSLEAGAQSIGVGSNTVYVQRVATWSDPGDDSQGTPIDMVQLDDGTGRFLVATQGGTIRVMNPDGQFLSDSLLTPTQTGNTQGWNLRYGLTSLQLHPNFSGDPNAFGYGKAYTTVTQPRATASADFGVPNAASSLHDNQSVVRELDLTPIVGNANRNTLQGNEFASRDILRIDQPQSSHNVWDLAFRNNGDMYVAVGDGGFSEFAGGTLAANHDRSQNPQDLDSIYGKILRINPDPAAYSNSNGRVSDNGRYSIPGDNAFYDGTNVGVDLDEIYANGVRSPFRLNVDPNDDTILWLGDVGEGRIEEVSKITSGGNYGWGLFEGTLMYESSVFLARNGPAIPPEFEYDHSITSDPDQPGGGRSITGGYIYDGELLGEDLKGQYIGAELGNYFGSGSLARLFTGDPDAVSRDLETLLLDLEGDMFDNEGLGLQGLPNLIISIAEDLNGELWVLGLEGTVTPGTENDGKRGQLVIARIIPEPGVSVLLLGLSVMAGQRRRRSR